MTVKYDQYRDTFYESRLNVARCRYLYALRQSGQQQIKAMKQAKADIAATCKNYRLDDPQTRNQYDALLRKIQQALKEEASGLASLEPAT